jgi:phosphoribosylanthranilate isomerase
MALQTLVKISGINNLTDARYCAGMGVEMLGFGIDETATDFIGFQQINDIIQWLSGVQLVGEIGKQTLATVGEYGFDYLETDNTQIIDNQIVSNNSDAKNSHIILKIVLNKTNITDNSVLTILEKYHSKVSYFLLESEMNLDELTINFLIKHCKKHSILVGFGIDNNNIHKILQDIKPAGIALKGGNEISPGLKDMDNLAEILESIEIL